VYPARNRAWLNPAIGQYPQATAATFVTMREVTFDPRIWSDFGIAQQLGEGGGFEDQKKAGGQGTWARHG